MDKMFLNISNTIQMNHDLNKPVDHEGTIMNFSDIINDHSNNRINDSKSIIIKYFDENGSVLSQKINKEILVVIDDLNM